MTPGDVANVATAFVAIAAFALSLYNFYVDRRDKRMRLAVALSQGTHEAAPEPPKGALFVEVINTGEKAVLITDVHIRFANEKEIRARVLGDGRVEARLPSGENAIFFVWLESAAASLAKDGITGRIKAMAQARDALGSVHRSKRTEIDLSPAAKGQAGAGGDAA